MLQTARRCCADTSGATAIEYALLGTLVGVALVATFTVFGEAVGNLFNSGALDTLQGAANSL